MENKLDMQLLEKLIRSMFELEQGIREVQTLTDVQCIAIANQAAAKKVDPNDFKALLLETARYCLACGIVDDLNNKLWSLNEQTAAGRRYYQALQQVTKENKADN